MAGLGGLKKQRRIQMIVLAFAALTATTALVGYAMQDGINFFRPPAEVLSNPPEPGEVFRLGGLVVKGSVVRGQGKAVTFSVTDCETTIPVSFTGILPDLFAEGQGMIGQGQMQGEVFVASEILAKHDENYMPKEISASLKDKGICS